MEISLEELLANEGFNERRLSMRPRSSKSMPLYPHRRSDFTSGAKSMTDRTRFDVHQSNSEGRISTCSGVVDTKPRENLVTGRSLDRVSKKEIEERVGARRSISVYKDKKICGEKAGIWNVTLEEVGTHKDNYINGTYNTQKRRERLPDGACCKMRGFEQGSMKEDFNMDSWRSAKGHSTSYDGSRKGSWARESTENDYEWSQRDEAVVQVVSEPALDEAAVRAVVSILVGSIKRFLLDEDFRISLHESCYSSLDFTEFEEANNAGRKVLSYLELAIQTIERAVDESVCTKDLKKASLQLSVITGLSLNMKDGFTAGVPNYKLSACAHVYLGVIYKLQRKERLSAKHLLQVFCISPFQARTILLPDLWENLFHPHLSHLKVWYDEEAASLTSNPSNVRKLRILDAVYNEVLNSGTNQFALYYKDWLTEGVQAPSVPTIRIPSMSAKFSECASSPATAFSPRPMVSKRLYQTVFSHPDSGNPEVEGGRICGNVERFDDHGRNYGGSPLEEKQIWHTYSFKTAESTSTCDQCHL